MGRIASVRTAFPPADADDGAGDGPPGEGEAPSPARRLAAALLAASPRVMVAGPGLCRVDARGWGRRGGEPAFARAVHRAAGTPVGVGISDVPVAADAAAALALRTGGPGRPRTRIVPPGGARSFLAPLPLEALGLPAELAGTLRTLGFRTVGEVAARERAELEARFGPEGSRAHRLARGEDGRLFRPLSAGDPPEASVELGGGGVREAGALLFVLGPLLDRLCEEVDGEGRRIGRLVLVLELGGGGRREVSVRPARPTLRRDLLHELCRAGLERSAGPGEEGLPAPVTGLALRAAERAAPAVRQEELFSDRSRDPVAAAAALSRIRARLGEDAVVAPDPLPHHRPERRSRWRPVSPPGDEGSVGEEGVRGGAARDERLPCVLRLLPEPRPLEVRCDAGRPSAVRDGEGLHELVAAEGPERLSGDWWEDPYRREYFRVCTDGGELLWIFREPRRRGGERWWLHGWWD